MKIQRQNLSKKNEAGLATVVFIALLAIMMILVTAETRALVQLRQENKLLEQQQIKRLNAIAAAQSETKSESK
ncbi:MAG TPA: hypothetical protein VHG71_01380 [Verrucomicrobiae bacterium]|nr:hypothetical protein [Verrucomicrobiae bacterium]